MNMASNRTTSNNNQQSDDDDEKFQVNKRPCMNDVIAIRADDMFKIAKTNQTKDDRFVINVFHNKLDKKAVHIFPEDILVNFDINCDSHIRTINELQVKNNVSVFLSGNGQELIGYFLCNSGRKEPAELAGIEKSCTGTDSDFNGSSRRNDRPGMQFTIQSMLEKIILVDDHYQLLNELVGNNSVDTNNIVSCVMDHISNIQIENHLQQLTKMIALQCFDTKSLSVIIDQIDSMVNSEDVPLKKKFIGRLLKETNFIIREKIFLLMIHSWMTTFAYVQWLCHGGVDIFLYLCVM
ncbi:unnamed protein product [Adineta ricciae]|uniref:Uncharacterized protein n=1 Tax=Adineta ricciae TaxID=249248 RepID=A0A814JBC0_ADIRI|nr:unnamed protein product [Adineta ricciae]CAF1492336.1 unnamed protein product [Adineta ricciae]